MSLVLETADQLAVKEAAKIISGIDQTVETKQQNIRSVVVVLKDPGMRVCLKEMLQLMGVKCHVYGNPDSLTRFLRTKQKQSNRINLALLSNEEIDPPLRAPEQQEIQEISDLYQVIGLVKKIHSLRPGIQFGLLTTRVELDQENREAIASQGVTRILGLPLSFDDLERGVFNAPVEVGTLRHNMNEGSPISSCFLFKH